MMRISTLILVLSFATVVIDGMPHEIDMTPIVEAGTPQRTVVQAEAEPPDEVQPRLGGSAEPGDVSGVGRDLGLPERDLQHADSCSEHANCSRCT